MASLGDLVATMSLNIGQFTGALGKVEQAVADATRSITKEFEKINGSLTGMVTGFLSVSTAMDLFNKSVDRAANLKDVGAAFDITVAKMDELSLAMQLAGVDSATLEKELKTLGNQVTLAQNPASKSAAVFAAMGVAIKDANGNMLGMDVIYENAIKQLGAIEDPTLRASAAMLLFGKGADEALKAVAQLQPALEEARKQMDVFGVTSDEAAKAAKSYKDNMLLLGDATSRSVTPIIAAIAPVLDDLRKSMQESSKGSVDLAKDLGEGLALAFRTLVKIVLECVGELKGVGLAIGAIAAAAVALVSNGKGGLAAASGILKMMTDDLEANKNATDAAIEAIDHHVEAFAYWHKSVTTADVDSAKLTAALAKMKDGGKAAALELETFTKLMNDQIAKQDKLTASTDETGKSNTEQVAVMKAVNDAFAAGHPMTLQHVVDLSLAAQATDALTDAKKQWLEQNKADQQAIDDYQKSLDAATKSLQTHLQTQEEALAKTVATKAAVEQLGSVYKDLAPYLVALNTDTAALAKLQADLLQEQQLGDAANAAYVASLKEQIDLTQQKIDADQTDFAQRKADIDQSKTWAAGWTDAFKQYEAGASDAAQAQTAFNGLTSSMETLFVNFANHSKDAFKTFAASVMQLIEQMAAKWAVSGLANMVFGGTAGAAGSLFSGAASGGVAAVGSAAEGAQLTAAFGGVAAGGTGILSTLGTSFTALGTVVTDGVGAIGTFSEALTAVLPALGAIGVAGLAAYALYQAFSKPGGGPKSGGSASTTGGPWSNFDVAGGTRGYTPSDADAALLTAVTANQQSYNTLIAALGGSGTAQFNLAYDTDPKGTAGTRIKAGASVNGQMVYGDVNRQFGSDSGDALTADLSLEAQRTLLAALQASNLPTQIANLLNTLTASTATSAQITQMLAVVQTVTAMNKALATLGDPMTAATTALATANETALQTWDDQRTALYNLANTAPDTVDGLNSVTTATQAFAQSTVTLLAGILNAKKALDAMFDATRETIQTGGMTDAQKYTFEQNKAQDLFTQLQGATDPDVIKTLSTEINDAITTAFGLLSPADQATAQTDFLAGLDQVQQTTDAKLQAAADAVAAQSKTDQQFISDQLTKILGGITDASTTFSNAAGQLANGVPVTVTVNTTTSEVNN